MMLENEADFKYRVYSINLEAYKIVSSRPILLSSQLKQTYHVLLTSAELGKK